MESYSQAPVLKHNGEKYNDLGFVFFLHDCFFLSQNLLYSTGTGLKCQDSAADAPGAKKRISVLN